MNRGESAVGERDLPASGEFEIVSLNVSAATGVRKRPTERVLLEAGRGAAGDAHAGLRPDRQVSLLALEDFAEGRKPGDYAENITTRGVELHLLPLGTRIEIGSAVLEITKIGKECHDACEIRRLSGDCVMPRRGVFAAVVKSGEVRREDRGSYRIG